MTTEAEYRASHPGELRLYDVGIDDFRAATQKDLDAMQDICQAYGRLSELFKKEHKALAQKIGWSKDEC